MQQPQNIPIRFLKGIGPKRAKAFAQRGVYTVEDLLYYFPRRYEDRTKFIPIAFINETTEQTVRGKIININVRRSFRRKNFSITEALVDDKTGRLTCIWFNQPYLKQYLKQDNEVILYGKTELYAGKLQMTNPEFEIVSEDTEDMSLHSGRIVPIYPSIEGLGQRALRKLMFETLNNYVPALQDVLPYDIRARYNLLNLAQSLINIHFPKDEHLKQEAYRRLAFEEFFIFQLPLAIRKTQSRQIQGIVHKPDDKLISKFIDSLPFKLTPSQIKVIEEIKHDMASTYPMHRLLQGDVGSGKTIVATIAALFAISSGSQVAFMVPTEILARQHYDKITGLFKGLNLTDGKSLNVALLSSSSSLKNKIIEDILANNIHLVIGTHALLEEEVRFHRLGLVIIDEQHRFGVGQRALLPAKGTNPDVLIMTATPIPRTLAITIYGDLDVSVISELPLGRKAIETVWITSQKRLWLYDFIRQVVQKGRQVYVVYPAIEESYSIDILSAEKMYEEFRTKVFPQYSIGLIHGKLRQKEQEKIMQDFKQGKLQILVATTVLEVGIDVPNAALMVIEQAERFGLAQLHQLRGRVGRGPWQSWCILVSDATTPEAKARLEALVKYKDGFRIAEEDLKIRGPGEYFGHRQHGLSGLRIGNPLTQLHLLKDARRQAWELIQKDPKLLLRQNVLLRNKLLQRFPEYENLVMVG
ncbi:MAG: ATP-dependent DNA helicase RecG [Candidatus Omnitrophica bacterium]|nr:ATP-dependent DNA helicase RecG [Candidatus Omnitrophota bacterium]